MRPGLDCARYVHLLLDLVSEPCVFERKYLVILVAVADAVVVKE
jgi:hypothetical protein